MKKFITLFLALSMMLSLAACGNKSDVPPQPGEGGDGGASQSQLENNGQGTDAATCTAVTPSIYQVFNEYTYDYLGISYVLPQDMQEKLKSGEMWVYNETQMKGAQDYDYSMMFFNLAEKDNPAKEVFASDEEYAQWLTTTKRFGAVIVVNSEYLKDHSVESITECKENKELGKSSDGRYVFYFSTNEVKGATELFKTIDVTVSDPMPIPATGFSVALHLLSGVKK